MRILSGIQPSGRTHIGNYFGMIQPALSLQKSGETLLFLADYHALTSQPNPEDLRTRVRDMALDFLALGLDAERTLFFRQSDVPEVLELSWILSPLTPVGLLERCHSYKDKLAKGLTPNSGLLTYPILMAADILLYQANKVPVGKDQKQHLEVTRDLAIRFNNEYGETFVIPEPFIQESLATVPGLDGQKMSKSYHNTIELFGTEKEIRKKFMSIQTDSKGLEEPKDPAQCNIYKLYELFASDAEKAEMQARYRAGNYGYGHAKQALFEKFWETMRPYRERRAELAGDYTAVEAVLKDGAARAREIAQKTLSRVREAVGLR